MRKKILGMDYATTVSQIFTTLGISNLFLMRGKGATIGRRLLHSLNFMRKLPQLIRDYSVFVFLSPPYFHLPSIFFLKLSGAKVITVIIDLYAEIAFEKFWQAPRHKKMLRWLMYPLNELSERLSVKLSDEVFCVSAYSVNKYRNFKEAKRIYNGADVASISKIKPKVYEKDTIFYMGGFLKWRGIDLLVRAFETVWKNHDVQLVLMGGSKEELQFYPELHELLKRSKDVKLIDYAPHDEAISYLKGAKIAVMPARDTFMTRALSSIKVFEYIAAEVPQVCTDTGEHAEWVKKLGVGVVVKDTAEDIAKGISLLLDDEKLYQKMRENCGRRKWEVDNKVLKKPLIKYFELLSEG